MQKIVTILMIILLTNPLFAMDESNLKTTFDGELFDETSECDDTQLRFRITFSLFMHLCVQASKCTTLPQASLQELLQKFKKKEIVVTKDSWTHYDHRNEKTDFIDMTFKDGYHRLAPYVSQVGVAEHNDDVGFFRVNDRTLCLVKGLFQTEKDLMKKKEADTKEKAENAASQVPIFRTLVYRKGHFSGESIIELGRATGINQEWIEDDTEHDQNIAKKFQKLIEKL